MNENATFVEDGMDDDIEFDDYSEEEEDNVADIDAVRDRINVAVVTMTVKDNGLPAFHFSYGLFHVQYFI